MKETTIGLLPLYLQLYDEVDPGKRPRVDKFYQTIADELEQRGLRVHVTGTSAEPKFQWAAFRFR